MQWLLCSEVRKTTFYDSSKQKNKVLANPQTYYERDQIFKTGESTKNSINFNLLKRYPGTVYTSSGGETGERKQVDEKWKKIQKNLK